MPPIPNVTINVNDPGLNIAEAAPEAFLVLGTASLGVDNEIQTFSRKNDVVGQFGEGPLSETMCKVLDVAGGPVRGMRLTKTVSPVFGAVSSTRTSTSTGTISAAITQKAASQVWQIDDPAGTPVFVDETADFNSSTINDVDPFPTADAVGDQFAIGFIQPFDQVTITVGTSGIGGVVTWNYFNGTAVVVLSGVVDGTTSFTVAPGTVTVAFTMPTDWERQSVNGSPLLYYIYAEIASGVYATDPIITQGFIDNDGAHDDYEVQVEILTTGTLGAGTFRYSLDDGRSFSGEFIIPTAGTFDIPFADITLTFTAGAGPIFFEDGDLFEFDVDAPYYSATEIATAVTALLAQSLEFPAIILTGTPASASDGATILTALDGHATSFENVNRYLRIAMDTGEDTTANVLTSFAAVSSRRVMAVFSTADLPSSKPFTGYNFPKRPAVEIVGAFAANQLISTSLNRVLLGPLPGVLEIGHDENLTEVLDAARIATLRTYNSRTGFFITHGRLKAPSGSDFRFWDFGRVMDSACRTTFIEVQNFIGISVRTNADGTIDERDATRLESIVNDALADTLVRPTNAEGTQGHVSAVDFSVDRSNNVNTTSTLQTEVAIRPLGKAFDIIVDIGFSLEAGEEAA